MAANKILRMKFLQSSEWRLRVWRYNGLQSTSAQFPFTVLKRQQSPRKNLSGWSSKNADHQ
jgi:hypothetical protein